MVHVEGHHFLRPLATKSVFYSYNFVPHFDARFSRDLIGFSELCIWTSFVGTYDARENTSVFHSNEVEYQLP